MGSCTARLASSHAGTARALQQAKSGVSWLRLTAESTFSNDLARIQTPGSGRRFLSKLVTSQPASLCAEAGQFSRPAPFTEKALSGIPPRRSLRSKAMDLAVVESALVRLALPRPHAADHHYSIVPFFPTTASALHPPSRGPLCCRARRRRERDGRLEVATWVMRGSKAQAARREPVNPVRRFRSEPASSVGYQTDVVFASA